MTFVTIHKSGRGADAMRVESYGNGLSLTIHFGEGQGPFRTLYFQDEDAATLREEFDAAESAWPEMATRDVWLRVLDPYL